MAKGRKSWRRVVLTALLILALIPVAGVLIVAIVPPPPTILMLRQLARGDGMDYQWRGLNQISPNLVNAAIAAEDATRLMCNGCGEYLPVPKELR